MLRQITSRFPAVCLFPKCKKPLLTGSVIWWNDEDKKVYCVDHDEAKITKVK